MCSSGSDLCARAMTSTLGATNKMVKLLGDDSVSRPDYADVVEGIADRIIWILKERDLTESELSRRAGKARSHVGLLLTKLRSDPGAVELKTLAGIAQAGEVKLCWLICGDGKPDEAAPFASAPGWTDLRAAALEEDPDLKPEFVDMAGATQPPPDAPRPLGVAWVVATAREYQRVSARAKAIQERSLPRNRGGKATTKLGTRGERRWLF